MNGYNLIRNWYAFKFENPSTVKSIHSELFCYIVDHWNRLGQKNEFGLPTMMTMEVLGIGSYNTYKKALEGLIQFGFVKIIKDSKNQHNSKIIALSKNDEASDKAIDKATIIARDKASDESLDKAIDYIDKQLNQETIKQLNQETKNKLLGLLKFSESLKPLDSKKQQPEKIDHDKIIAIFNSVCKNLPTVQKLTKTRKAAINARISEYNLSTLGDVFQQVAKSRFLNGDNDRNWSADFDWVMNPNNFIKILEGKYNSKPTNKNWEFNAEEVYQSEAAKNFKFQ